MLPGQACAQAPTPQVFLEHSLTSLGLIQQSHLANSKFVTGQICVSVRTCYYYFDSLFLVSKPFLMLASPFVPSMFFSCTSFLFNKLSGQRKKLLVYFCRFSKSFGFGGFPGPPIYIKCAIALFQDFYGFIQLIYLWSLYYVPSTVLAVSLIASIPFKQIST